MKSINKTKNDSISEQASATKEEMIEFASKYKNIEAFKDSDDETTYWVIMLFILLMYIDYNTQKLLATNGMLVKRPLVVNGDTVLVGFKEAEWAEKLN